MGKKTHGNCEVSYCCCPVAKSYLTLRHNGLQHARLPCPSVPTGICSNSCPLSQWCHPTISSSVASFFSCLLSFPASGYFPVGHLSSRGQNIGALASTSVLPMNHLFTSGGQSIGSSASVLPVNIQSLFPLQLVSRAIDKLNFALCKLPSSVFPHLHWFLNAGELRISN